MLAVAFVNRMSDVRPGMYVLLSDWIYEQSGELIDAHISPHRLIRLGEYEGTVLWYCQPNWER